MAGGLQLLGSIVGVAPWVGVASFIFSVMAVLVYMVLRFRVAPGEQRQQLRGWSRAPPP